ncbi:MAG: hypothetical protein K6F20_02175 [Bacteroidaceae bacterium]|nr:hypothetical protein [Bacteroidaceae bacterium]
MSDFPDLFEKIRAKVLSTAVKGMKVWQNGVQYRCGLGDRTKIFTICLWKGKNELFEALFDSFGGFESKNTLFCADLSRKILQIGQKAIPLPYILILK